MRIDGIPYIPAADRYESMPYRRVGKWGLKLPALSLGLWQNFGDLHPFGNQREIVRAAFDAGITHFDLANNYGPPAGAAEINFGEMLRTDLAHHRDELIISTKAGHVMWDGPYGSGGSTRKYLLASLDQSLTRLGLDYVDIFYSHRFDAETPLEETMMALDQAVRSGRALYVGISSYDAKQTRAAAKIAADLGTPLLIHQPSYNMFNRWIERDTEDGSLRDACADNGMGIIGFSPLGQGLLTDKYLHGIPEGSRGSYAASFDKDWVNDEVIGHIQGLNKIAESRGQSLAQMAISWVLRDPRVTSTVAGASSVKQLQANLKAVQNLEFSDDELKAIDEHAVELGVNRWSTWATA